MKTPKGPLFAAGKLLLVLLGNTLYALAIALFVLPSGLITGGTTGLGLVAQHLLGLPLSAFVGLFNAAMFVVGLCLLGKVFALTTAVSSFYFGQRGAVGPHQQQPPVSKSFYFWHYTRPVEIRRSRLAPS